MSILQSVPIGAEFVGAKIRNVDRDSTMAEKDCVLTSREEEMDELSDFVLQKLHFLGERGLNQFVEE